MTKKTFLEYISYGTLLLTFTLIVSFGWMAFYPFNVIDITQPYKVETPVVQAGNSVGYTFTFCKHHDVVAHIIHQLEGDVGDIAIPYTSAPTLRLADKCDTRTKWVNIPTYIPEGEYILCEYIDYHINFLQTVSYTFCTEPFNITQ